MTSTLATAILIVLALVFVGFGFYIRAYIKNLFRQDLQQDWQWARLIYELRDSRDDSLPQ